MDRILIIEDDSTFADYLRRGLTYEGYDPRVVASAEAGLAGRFEELKVFLLANEEPASYAEIARRLSLSEGAVRSAIYRMRQRYGELFRAEIAQTVTGVAEMEEEIRHFLKVLGG